MVLVREPGERRYAPPAPASREAARLWPYAVLSANVYHGAWRSAPPESAEAVSRAASRAAADPAVDPYVQACLGDPRSFLPIEGWTSWRDFPSEALRADGRRLGLYMEAWENASMSPPVVAVVFRGTDFRSLPDWRANLRWFARFVPGYEDQYTLVSSRLGREFVERAAARLAAGGPGAALRVVSAGHSLGGGLAQHFAYSLPPASDGGVAVPRVEHVYAFDPSPVTGWYSVPRELREANARGLVIDRVFEHGEVLAYLRLLQSYVMPPSAQDPAVREIRFNFHVADAFANHSMVRLACDLALARHPAAAGSRSPAGR